MGDETAQYKRESTGKNSNSIPPKKSRRGAKGTGKMSSLQLAAASLSPSVVPPDDGVQKIYNEEEYDGLGKGVQSIVWEGDDRSEDIEFVSSI